MPSSFIVDEQALFVIERMMDQDTDCVSLYCSAETNGEVNDVLIQMLPDDAVRIGSALMQVAEQLSGANLRFVCPAMTMLEHRDGERDD